MICQRCLRLGARRSTAPAHLSRRALSATATRAQPVVTADTATATNPRPDGHPAATSTSAAQPFTAGSTPGADEQVERRGPSEPSIAPAGTVLKYINFLKAGSDPVALEDHEYPEWLWRALDKKGGAQDGGAEGDLFSKSKKQRTLAAKALRKKQAALDPADLAPKVPVFQQTVDLPGGEGLAGAREAAEAREELTKAMREERRRKIKEMNFLKKMR